MPYVNTSSRTREPHSFALMINRGDSLSPTNVTEIERRTHLSPIFITFSDGASLDISRRYAREVGAKLFMPRTADAARQIISTCNFSICEGFESAIFSLSAKIPAYVYASSPECRSFAARLCAVGISPSLLIPYTKNRTGIIKRLPSCEYELTAQTRAELRAVLSLSKT